MLTLKLKLLQLFLQPENLKALQPEYHICVLADHEPDSFLLPLLPEPQQLLWSPYFSDSDLPVPFVLVEPLPFVLALVQNSMARLLQYHNGVLAVRVPDSFLLFHPIPYSDSFVAVAPLLPT
ncbi:hypothetical protein D3C85_1533020 [compost metagenome]